MIQSGPTIWHYLGSFILYTLVAIGFIYAAYWYARKNSGNLLGGARKPVNPKTKLEIESVLALEVRKNLYVVRSGNERFLIATSMEGTQFLSRLETTAMPVIQEVPSESAEIPVEGTVAPPWYSRPEETPDETAAKGTFGSRFMQSVQWLISSRTKLT